MLPSPCVTQPKNLIVEWLTGCYHVLSRLAHGDLNAVLCSGDQNIIHPCLVRTQHRLQPDMSSSIPTSAFVPHFYKTLITSQDLRHRVRFLFSRISLSDLIIIWPLRLHFPLYKWWILTRPVHIHNNPIFLQYRLRSLWTQLISGWFGDDKTVGPC